MDLSTKPSPKPPTSTNPGPAHPPDLLAGMHPCPGASTSSKLPDAHEALLPCCPHNLREVRQNPPAWWSSDLTKLICQVHSCWGRNALACHELESRPHPVSPRLAWSHSAPPRPEAVPTPLPLRQEALPPGSNCLVLCGNRRYRLCTCVTSSSASSVVAHKKYYWSLHVEEQVR